MIARSRRRQPLSRTQGAVDRTARRRRHAADVTPQEGSPEGLARRSRPPVISETLPSRGQRQSPPVSLFSDPFGPKVQSKCPWLQTRRPLCRREVLQAGRPPVRGRESRKPSRPSRTQESLGLRP